MRPDTPLDEVAQHIPAEAAGLLSSFDSEIQVLAVEQIRRILCEWEEKNVYLDPVELEAVLTTFTTYVVASAISVRRAQEQR